jgi:glycosyltransferase involved in cell wall biosynthesis
MGETNRKIKILFTIPNFNTAGSGKVLYDLVNGLDPERFEVSVVCNHDRGDLFEHVKALGVQMYLIRSTVPLRPYFNLIFRLKDFRSFIKTHQFDIVHSWHWSSDWTEALAARLSGVRWLYTKKAMGFDNVHWKIRSYLANFIVTINNEMQAYFPNKKQQALIPLGIDSDYYNAKAFEAKSHSGTNEFHIITVANLVPVKGIEVLINAVHKLNDASVKLTILGDHTGEYGDAMIALKDRLDMHQQVQFLGKQLDVRPKLAASDLYVIPTLDEGRKEGMPMALVEAMCMGIPVLGSNITGINFVLKDFDNLLFQPGEAEELTLKINAIRSMSIEERNKLGSSLRDYCLKHFSLETFIKAHETVYLNLAKI